MAYLFLYIAGIALIWWIYIIGWVNALKIILGILIPSSLIILFNLKMGRFLFRSPIVGIISVLPTAIFIFKASQPLVAGINSWIDNQNSSDGGETKDVVEVKVISKDDA